MSGETPLTLGDVYPRLRELPGYEEVAARPFVVPPGIVRAAEGVDPPPARPPTRREMLASFAQAMRGLVADGGRLAPRDVRQARRAACDSCPHHDADRDACKLCGCGSMIPGGLAAKRAIASSECPDNPPRWGTV